MIENNIAPNTQIGKVIIDEKVYENENFYKTPEEMYSRGGEFIDNMVCDNDIEFCHRWFHLANIQEMIQDINDYFTNHSIGSYDEFANNYRTPLYPKIKNLSEVAVDFDYNKIESPVEFYKEKPNITYEDLVLQKEKEKKHLV